MSAAPPTKKQKHTPNPTTKGPTHQQSKQRLATAKSTLSSLPSHQKSSVLARYRGSSSNNTQMHKLRHDDLNEDTSNLSSYQIRNLKKRRNHVNHDIQRMTQRRETKRLENALESMYAEEILQNSNGLLEAEHDMESTLQMTQDKLRGMLEENVTRNIYDLELKEYSPYIMKYDRSGRYSLLCGRKGHVSIIDQHSLGLKTEFHLNETCRDACFLQDGSLMAVAQEKAVYIYDENGAEVHRLEAHRRVFGMEFLPYHWLLGELDSLLLLVVDLIARTYHLHICSLAFINGITSYLQPP